MVAEHTKALLFFFLCKNYSIFFFFQVMISVSAFAIATYVKVAIGAVMREKGRKHLLWFGVCTQVGSCIGALSMFAPVNVYKFFKTY